jgi:hypothetical protein
MNSLRIGDIVKFNITCKEMFIKETTGADEATTKYQQLILNGIDEMGEIDEFIGNISNVKFSDVWELPIATKYLILVSNPN